MNHLQGQGSPETEDACHGYQNVHVADKDTIEVVTEPKGCLVSVTYIRSKDVVNVILELILKDAPVDPDVVVVVVWFITIHLESKRGRMV